MLFTFYLQFFTLFVQFLETLFTCEFNLTKHAL